jgi:hypothetical protein
VTFEGDSAAALRGAVDVVRLEGGDAGDLGAVEQDECADCPDVGGQVGVADSSRRFSDELGKAFWVAPADHANPGPVTDWRRVEP